MNEPTDRGSRARRFLSSTLLLRVVAFVTVFAAAVVGFRAGVGASERDLAAMGLFEHAYYALGLFVLGGLDIGTPVGGPGWARAIVWGAYFAAPVITAFAIVETVLRVLGPWGLRIRRLSGHVVLAGAGRMTLTYVRKLRPKDPRRTIVVVDRASDGPYHAELVRSHGAILVRGDAASDRVLGELSLGRARRVLFFTDDDFVNLDAAAKSLRLAPELAGRIVVHVSDLRFMQQTAGSSVSRDCVIFNGHEFAARHLVAGQLVAHFKQTPGRDPVVLGGFGRFGRTVLDQLQRLAPDRFGPVVIVDYDATANVRVFDEEPGFQGNYARHVFDGDMLDPDIWARVHAVTSAEPVAPVFILGSGSDGTNLQGALTVRRAYPDAQVVVRSFRASPFTTEVAQEAGLHAVNLGRLIQDGMPDDWF